MAIVLQNMVRLQRKMSDYQVPLFSHIMVASLGKVIYMLDYQVPLGIVYNGGCPSDNG